VLRRSVPMVTDRSGGGGRGRGTRTRARRRRLGRRRSRARGRPAGPRASRPPSELVPVSRGSLEIALAHVRPAPERDLQDHRLPPGVVHLLDLSASCPFLARLRGDASGRLGRERLQAADTACVWRDVRRGRGLGQGGSAEWPDRSLLAHRAPVWPVFETRRGFGRARRKLARTPAVLGSPPRPHSDKREPREPARSPRGRMPLRNLRRCVRREHPQLAGGRAHWRGCSLDFEHGRQQERPAVAGSYRTIFPPRRGSTSPAARSARTWLRDQVLRTLGDPRPDPPRRSHPGYCFRRAGERVSRPLTGYPDSRCSARGRTAAHGHGFGCAGL